MTIDLSDERTARIALAHATTPGHALTRWLIAEHGCSGTVQLALTGRRPLGITELGFDTWRSHTLPRLDQAQLERVFDQAEAQGLTVFTPDDHQWQASGLTALGERAPLALWARGDITIFGRPLAERVGIVGARAGTQYGHHVTRELVAGLATTGHTIVSTAASGTAATAHRAALADGAATIAVLAGGVGRELLGSSVHLRTALFEHGLLLSEASPEQQPTRERFEQRARLLAALTAATVIVEVSSKSGLGVLVDEATALHRPIGAVPGPTTSATSVRCHQLINEGTATLVATAEQVRALIADTVPALPAAQRAGRSPSRQNPLPSIDRIGRRGPSQEPSTTLGR